MPCLSCVLNLFRRFPAAQSAFDRLAGQITADDMRTMNYAVDGEKKDAGAVVKEFLEQHALI